MGRQYEEAATSSLMRQARQSDIDGNIRNRNRRAEIQFSNEERDELVHRPIDASYISLAQYFRETVLNTSAEPASSEEEV
ncbi:hypothetical protein [Burkholderia ubonensis]|uniref:hypothetical protein n=1 Tax=Burkholderia ubonensis TaxID=101571 RepID=UPI0012F829D5|nr:hypothetical protein [Burkholderia ubonensis]